MPFLTDLVGIKEIKIIVDNDGDFDLEEVYSMLLGHFVVRAIVAVVKVVACAVIATSLVVPHAIVGNFDSVAATGTISLKEVLGDIELARFVPKNCKI